MSSARGDEAASSSRTPPRRRVWAQDVAVNVDVLRMRLNRLKVRGPQPVPAQRQAVIDGVERLLGQAYAAAYRDDPQPTRLGNWWRGTLIEAAYQNLHAAEAEIVALYDDDEVDVELPEALARVQVGLNRDDPRRVTALHLPRMPRGPQKRLALRKTIEVGYAAADRQHSRVRSFRNVVLVTAAFIAFFVAMFAGVVAVNPDSVPLCFEPEGRPTACPAGGDQAQALDVIVVLLLGLLGGALAAAVSVRNIRGTSTPYDIPIALAVLKVPAGALTALGALIAIRGEFVPGLSALDSQEQILAYALVFGYAQQILTRLIDAQAGTVLDSVPSKDPTVARRELDELEVEAPRPAVEAPPPPQRGEESAGSDAAKAGSVKLP